jgi:integrase
MTGMLILKSDNTTLTGPGDLAGLGQSFNEAASLFAFESYRQRKAGNTVRMQDNDLESFAAFLRTQGIEPGELSTNPQAWAGVTWGLLEGFKQWQLGQGYAINTINRRLTTVKIYAELATRAGLLSELDLMMIDRVKGYSQTEGRRVDTQRQDAGLSTRFQRPGAKKAESVSINREQAAALKAQPDTPQGRRDSLLMCLLLEHGLRCGEVAGLQVSNFDLQAGELRFYRPKVDKTQTHKLSPDTLRAARAYFEHDAPEAGPVLRGSRKDGRLHDAGMSERAITKRVSELGRAIGIAGLSAHDLRHYWATTAARNGTQLDRLQDAGGWSSPAMPLRYIETAKIANEGVRLE